MSKWNALLVITAVSAFAAVFLFLWILFQPRITASSGSQEPPPTATPGPMDKAWSVWGNFLYQRTSDLMARWEACVTSVEPLSCHDSTRDISGYATTLLNELHFGSPVGYAPNPADSNCGQGIRQLQLALQYIESYRFDGYEPAALHFGMADGAKACPETSP